MRNVMKRAWVIAKAAVVKFCGKVREYFAAALRQAWSEARAPKTVEIEIPADTRKCRTYVARITGTHPVYKLNREFLNQDDDGQYGEKVFHLTEGYYEINNGRRKILVKISNGTETVVDATEVLAGVA